MIFLGKLMLTVSYIVDLTHALGPALFNIMRAPSVLRACGAARMKQIDFARVTALAAFTQDEEKQILLHVRLPQNVCADLSSPLPPQNIKACAQERSSVAAMPVKERTAPAQAAMMTFFVHERA